MDTEQTSTAVADKPAVPEANDRSFQLLMMISRVVHERRAQLGMTQDKLALLTGLHRTYISDIERGARNLSVKSLVKLAEALKLDPSIMLEWAEKKLYANHQL